MSSVPYQWFDLIFMLSTVVLFAFVVSKGHEGVSMDCNGPHPHIRSPQTRSVEC